jgi:hypothetical protein
MRNATESAFVEWCAVLAGAAPQQRLYWQDGMREWDARSDLSRDQFAFSLLCGYQFALSRSCNGSERFATQAKVADDVVAIP